MGTQLELLKIDDMRRDAEFVGELRVRLSRDWSDGPRALAIGCNPSTANAFVDDPTTRWWNRWFRHNRFGGYDAMNLYPFCTSKPTECKALLQSGCKEEQASIMAMNLSMVIDTARSAEKIFVCWGNIAWDRAWVTAFCERLKSELGDDNHLWCWGKTLTGAPKHPMARGKHRIALDVQPMIWRNEF